MPLRNGHRFASTSDLCTSYPNGVGLYCNAIGHIEQRQPESLISRVEVNVLNFCLSYCRCIHIAPDVPSQEGEAPIAQGSECTTSSDDGTIGDEDEQPSSSSTCSRPGPTGQTNADESECNEYWYGRPNNQDCQQAMLGLPNQGDTVGRLRTFIPMGTMFRGPTFAGPPIRTPLILTHGA